MVVTSGSLFFPETRKGDLCGEGDKIKEGLAPLLDALQGGSSDVTRTEPFWVNPASWFPSSWRETKSINILPHTPFEFKLRERVY